MTSAPTGSAPERWRPPAQSTDCHIHVYDEEYPFDEAANLRPTGVALDDYLRFRDELGLERTVLVQPSSYGTDNRCLLDALARLGDDARGVAVLSPEVSDDELRRLDGLGVRGIRFNLTRPAGPGTRAMRELSARIAPLGWHVQVHTMGDMFPALADDLRALESDVVIDHLGRINPSAGMAHPAAEVIGELLDGGRGWMKLSGAYHDTADPGRYSDTVEIARAWFQRAPERCVWGTDWPHPSAMAGEKPLPDDRTLLDLVPIITGSESAAVKLMVDNPAALYGF